jgi:hypothetical protein
LYRAAVWGIYAAPLDDVICIEVVVVVVVDMVLADEREWRTTPKNDAGGLRFITVLALRVLYCVALLV